MPQQPVDRSEILDIAQYEKVRPEFRARMMAAKNRRRVSVGPHFTFLFENHDTVLYQVQEMMRVERIVDEQAIAHELKTYNELIPATTGLSATLLLEYDSRADRSLVLPKLTGIQDHVWLVMGDQPRIAAAFDTRQIGDERVSSVQYLQFPLTGAQCREWRDLGLAGGIRLIVDHSEYHHEAVMPADTVNALADDLA